MLHTLSQIPFSMEPRFKDQQLLELCNSCLHFVAHAFGKPDIFSLFIFDSLTTSGKASKNSDKDDSLVGEVKVLELMWMVAF